jgi:hypothetical protein
MLTSHPRILELFGSAGNIYKVRTQGDNGVMFFASDLASKHWGLGRRAGPNARRLEVLVYKGFSTIGRVCHTSARITADKSFPEIRQG